MMSVPSHRVIGGGRERSMTEEQYRKIEEPFRRDPEKRKWLRRLNRWITAFVYVIYIVTGGILFCSGDQRLRRYLSVPAAGFLGVSMFRKKLNRPRPYEVWNIRPLINKKTKGKSFPSRHIFSIYMVAMAVLFIFPPLGILLLLLGVVLAAVRVVSGVHFLKDVIAGAGIAIGIGVTGFFCSFSKETLIK